MKKTLAALVFVCALALAGCDTAGTDGADVPESRWKVVATHAGDRQISAIKTIREVTSLGLKDAKDLADTMPSVIVSGLSEAEAQTTATKLREAGMTVQVEQE